MSLSKSWHPQSPAEESWVWMAHWVCTYEHGEKDGVSEGPGGNDLFPKQRRCSRGRGQWPSIYSLHTALQKKNMKSAQSGFPITRAPMFLYISHRGQWKHVDYIKPASCTYSVPVPLYVLGPYLRNVAEITCSQKQPHERTQTGLLHRKEKK